MTSERALIIEDDERYAEILSALLKLRGWKSETARSMAEAFEIITRQPMEVVLLDLRLTDSDTDSSLDRISTIKQHGARLVIIVTGAPITDTLKDLAKTANADAVLSKDRDIPERLYEIIGRPEASHIG